MKRSLFQCFYAKVKGDIIICDQGCVFDGGVRDSISILKLKRGAPLEMTVCQKCLSYDCMGDPVPPNERGWATIGVPENPS